MSCYGTNQGKHVECYENRIFRRPSTRETVGFHWLLGLRKLNLSPKLSIKRRHRRISLWRYHSHRASNSGTGSCVQSRRFEQPSAGFPGTFPGLAGCALYGLHRATAASNPLHRARTAMLEMLRQIAQVDEVARSGDTRAGNDVFQFTHIAWPWMLQQNCLCAPR